VSNHTQTDFIILTAGARDGVVEGMDFQLREEKGVAPAGEVSNRPFGMARVLYAGEDHAMARILYSHRPILVGFEARYQP
jgi:hypothetical protein